MIARRTEPIARPWLGDACTPRSSGPRWRMASRRLSTAAARAVGDSFGSWSPAMPHMEPPIIAERRRWCPGRNLRDNTRRIPGGESDAAVRIQVPQVLEAFRAAPVREREAVLPVLQRDRSAEARVDLRRLRHRRLGRRL